MSAGRLKMVGALGAAVVLQSACSSSSGTPVIAAFTAADCRGGLVEIARYAQTLAPLAQRATTGNLVLDGDTLYMTYATAATASGLPISGGIVALPVSGGPGRVVAAADTAKTSQWDVDSFWVAGGQIYLQTGAELASVPTDPPAPSALSVVLASGDYAAYAHDADFGYSAVAGVNGLTVAKTPVAGGAPTVMIASSAPMAPGFLGGMADAGDALLLHVGWGSNAAAQVWRIPKDGTTPSDARPDVHWADPLEATGWLAWDGADIIAPTLIQNYLVQSRVSPTGTSAPVQTRLSGIVATRRNDEILSFQLMARQPQEASARPLVVSSKGAPAGTVVACGDDTEIQGETPTGIAANDSAIYVAYWTGSDTVVARVMP